MKKAVIITLTMSLFLMHQAKSLFAEATPQQVVTFVQEATDYISKTGEVGIKNLTHDKRWDQGELYIFAQDCKKKTLIAHSKVEKLVGKSLAIFKDRKGNFFAMQMCDALEQNEKSWVDYWWLHPVLKKTARKISLIQRVPGTDFAIGAGIYNELIPTKLLNKSFR